MSNFEELMTELMRASVVLKRALYRRDEAASTSPEGADGPTILVHTCLVCERSAAGKGAQVRHMPKCALARLQRAQAALREASSEMFTSKATPSEAEPPLAPDAPQSRQEIRVRAERKCGELLAETVEPGRPKNGNQTEPFPERQTLADLGISKLQSFEWQKRATVPEPDFEAPILAQLVSPESAASQRKVRQRRQPAQLGAVHQDAPVPTAPVYVPPSQVRRAPAEAAR